MVGADVLGRPPPHDLNCLSAERSDGSTPAHLCGSVSGEARICAIRGRERPSVLTTEHTEAASGGTPNTRKSKPFHFASMPDRQLRLNARPATSPQCSTGNFASTPNRQHGRGGRPRPPPHDLNCLSAECSVERGSRLRRCTLNTQSLNCLSAECSVESDPVNSPLSFGRDVSIAFRLNARLREDETLGLSNRTWCVSIAFRLNARLRGGLSLLRILRLMTSLNCLSAECSVERLAVMKYMSTQHGYGLNCLSAECSVESLLRAALHQRLSVQSQLPFG